MEATGVYWYSLYEHLYGAHIEVCLVNGAHTKNVPGRKSDIQDCQWLHELHSYGLLRPSFIPDELSRQLRTYTRLRDDHIGIGAMYINQMQKVLISMNIRLSQVISQITGVSGLRIIEAILSGQRDPEQLANLCVQQIQSRKRTEVVRSLEGHYKDEHLFALFPASLVGPAELAESEILEVRTDRRSEAVSPAVGELDSLLILVERRFSPER